MACLQSAVPIVPIAPGVEDAPACLPLLVANCLAAVKKVLARANGWKPHRAGLADAWGEAHLFAKMLELSNVTLTIEIVWSVLSQLKRILAGLRDYKNLHDRESKLSVLSGAIPCVVPLPYLQDWLEAVTEVLLAIGKLKHVLDSVSTALAHEWAEHDLDDEEVLLQQTLASSLNQAVMDGHTRCCWSCQGNVRRPLSHTNGSKAHHRRGPRFALAVNACRFLMFLVALVLFQLCSQILSACVLAARRMLPLPEVAQ